MRRVLFTFGFLLLTCFLFICATWSKATSIETRVDGHEVRIERVEQDTKDINNRIMTELADIKQLILEMKVERETRITKQ